MSQATATTTDCAGTSVPWFDKLPDELVEYILTYAMLSDAPFYIDYYFWGSSHTLQPPTLGTQTRNQEPRPRTPIQNSQLAHSLDWLLV